VNCALFDEGNSDGLGATPGPEVLMVGGREVDLGAYASAVPVSRKRKKKKSGKSGGPHGRASVDRRGSAGAVSARDRELADAFRGLAAHRNQLEMRRAERAAEMATELVADLVSTG
jgi:hypothetical protein